MNAFVLVYLCFFVLPFPITFVYALVKRANKFLVITPLIISVIHPLLLYKFITAGEMAWGLRYIGGCFILMIIGTVGFYYGFVKRQFWVGESEMGLGAFRSFAVCICIVIFPIIPAGMFCWGVHTLHGAKEDIIKKRPELGKHPSWQDIVKEKEKEEGE